MAVMSSVNATGSDQEWISNDDAAWILTNAFLVLTMQSGFGLLEAGCVSSKNSANIMVKNVVDVTLGGITYWALGYGISFGEPSTPFAGMGNFFLHADGSKMGSLYTKYVFQFSFATAATTVVSGAIAERMKLKSYMVFSMLNTFVYCFTVCWVWNDVGFLQQLGFHDWAGGCVVHLTGGASAFVAAWMLGPRLGRFGPDDQYEMSSPVTALTGTFMLWWAWLGFNCGSSFGIVGQRWKVAAKVGVNTLNGSIGGGIAGLLISAAVNKGHFDISYLIMSVLGGLVSVTAACAVMTPMFAIILGSLGASSAIGLSKLLDYFAVIDDPVGAVPVHFGAALVGTVAVGFLAENDLMNQLHGRRGLFYGGGFYLLGIQIFGALVVVLWSAVCTALCFLLMEKTIGVRVTPEQEILGADWVEHRVRSVGFAHKLEEAFRKLNIANDEAALEALMKKLTDEAAEASARPAAARIRRLSATERRQSLLAAAVRNLHQQQPAEANRNLRGIPSTALVDQEDDRLPGMIEAALAKEQHYKDKPRRATATSVKSLAAGIQMLRRRLEGEGIVINPNYPVMISGADVSVKTAQSVCQ